MSALLAFLGRWLAQPDKALHVAAGAILTGALAWALLGVLDPLPAAVAALWFGLALSWAKERYDKAHPDVHTWDGWDAYATTCGALAGVTLVLLLA